MNLAQYATARISDAHTLLVGSSLSRLRGDVGGGQMALPDDDLIRSILYAQLDYHVSDAFVVSDKLIGNAWKYSGKTEHARINDYAATGVGLAAVWRIVERYGGRIWTTARQGQGATFYFTMGTA